MIVGIDVHKRSHAAALVDERGAPLATLTIPNSPAGVARLCRWLSEYGARTASLSVSRTRAAMAASSAPCSPRLATRYSTSLPGGVAIGQRVLRHWNKLGPALEPPLIRAIALLETHSRQSVGRRTDAIQRLRAVWMQLDPEAESATPNAVPSVG